MTDLQQIYLWSPFFLIFGISIYFKLPFEPSLSILTILLLINIVLSHYSFHSKQSIFYLFSFLSLIIFGCLLITCRSAFLNTKMIQKKTFLYDMQAEVKNINQYEKSTSIILTNIQHKYYKNINNIKIFTRKKLPDDLKIGDKIETSVLLMPFKQNFLPNHYNEKRINFFFQNSAKGFAIRDINIIEKNNHNSIENLRQLIEQKINLYYKNNNLLNNGLISALLIGKKNFIPHEIIESFRFSGTSHLLAISGLHLAIFSGWVFIFIKLLITAMGPYIFTQYDSQIIAAFIGIIAGLTYLQLAGSPISAQRSFIMIMIFYIALIMQKNYVSTHSLVIAANFLLIKQPEIVLMPGFQMSFIGVTAILCATRFPNPFSMKIFKIIYSSLISSILATIFTAPYTIFNFHTFNLSGIIANIIAIPLMSLIIMPLIIILLIFILFNIQYLIIPIIDFFLQILIKITGFFSSIDQLNFNNLYISSQLLLAITFLCVCIFLKTNKKIISFSIILIFISIIFESKPQIIAHNNNIFFTNNGHLFSLYKTKKSKSIKEIEDFFHKSLNNTQNSDEKITLLNNITINQLLIDLKNKNIKYQDKIYDFSNQQIYWIYVKKNKIKIVEPQLKNRPWNI